MELLSSLKKEEILEILSHGGLCHCCQTLVHDRIRTTLHKRKRGENLYEDLEDIRRKSPRRHWHSRHNFGFDSSHKYIKESKEADSELLLNDGIIDVYYHKNELSDSEEVEERKEFIRYSEVCCKKDFTYIERLNGRDINLLQGLELHTDVFNFTEQNEIVEYIYRLQRIGQEGRLRDKTYSKPRKWMRGKGRETIQFGCCYNYAVDKNGNPPVSFLSEAKILFGSNLKAIRPGEFSGPASISLPVGSVFVLKGNGADIAKHCVPSVSSKRISITFRKMDERKLPYNFSPDPELMGIKPLIQVS
ncbi:hypothetical protein TSUD_04820 [Trifolium subterraneum]|uniref:Fe2OG dioxygenase domain-containing protein n=1 Tax=Trifolium subterraneum TaxID=3900 RepID=A0A2Z6NST5_TRISU|nr:hypothetical protein TSUD_04820 [Trifolium subterraneum]